MPVPASEAIARSLNIPSVTMLQRYGVPKFHSFLKQIGLTTLNRPSSHYGLSLILGGAEATLWDITSAYANMGRSLNRLPQFPCTLLLSDSISVHRPSFQSGAVWQTFDAIKEVKENVVCLGDGVEVPLSRSHYKEVKNRHMSKIRKLLEERKM